MTVYRWLSFTVSNVSNGSLTVASVLLSNAARKLMSLAFSISMRGATFDNLRIVCQIQGHPGPPNWEETGNFMARRDEINFDRCPHLKNGCGILIL